MDTGVVGLAAAAVALAAAAVLAVVAAVMSRRLRQLRRLLDVLGQDLVPLAHQARVAADHAATELERVGDVLGSAEAVSATVDSASRLAYRAFSNPAVKTLSYATGVNGALHRLFGRARAVR